MERFLGSGENLCKSHEAGNRLAYRANIKKANAFPTYLLSERDKGPGRHQRGKQDPDKPMALCPHQRFYALLFVH